MRIELIIRANVGPGADITESARTTAAPLSLTAGGLCCRHGTALIRVLSQSPWRADS